VKEARDETVTPNMRDVPNGKTTHKPNRRGNSVAGREPDLDRAEVAVAALFDALGIELTDEGTIDTPRRVACMYAELLTPRTFDPTTFDNDGGYDELILARAIPFVSLCQHHALPFHGVAHVGYIPGKRILGLSKLARVVHYFSCSLQLQERLTKQVADWLQHELEPKGVGVIAQAEHLCMTLRGVQAAGTETITSTMYGLLRDSPATRREFLDLVRLEGSR
jgi:GTP cyclohydrolase I